MANPAILAVEIQSDASKAVRGFDDVGDAATAMAREVDKATSNADRASGRLDRVGDSADGLDSKASQATGSLGALAAGFELAGAEKYAGTLQSAAMATDFLSGVGSGLNLILQLNVFATLKAKAATLASTAATKAAAAGQWALNAALAANPIGLIVIAALALVAGFVLLYKRSERFRNIVQSVGKVGKQAIGWVVDAVSGLVGWIGDKLPGAASTAQRLVVGYVKLITLPMRTLLTVIKDISTWVRDKVPGAFVKMKDKAVAIGEALLAPFQKLLDLVKDIIDWISKIDIPDLPHIDLNPFRSTAGTTDGSPSGAAAGFTTYNITVTGAVDPDAVARQIDQLLSRRARRVRTVTL